MKKKLAAHGRPQGKERKMEGEIGSTMSQSLANSLRTELWTCRKTD
jgi:hypothetical protein